MQIVLSARRTALVASFGAMCLALSGCGGGSSTPAPVTPPVQTAPTLTSSLSPSVIENTAGVFYTATASDPQNDPITITLYSGPDADKLVLDAAGGLRFNRAPNFDLPIDANRDNIYEITLRVTAGGESRDFAVRVSVSNDRERVIVRRAATGFVDPVAIAQIVGQPTLLIAERSGRVLRFDQTNDAVTEDTYIRDRKLPGEILAIGYAFPGHPTQRGVYMVTHSPATGLLLQAFDEGRSAFGTVKLADAWSRATTVSFIYQPRVLLAIGSPTESEAQDAASGYGKLIELQQSDPFAGASLRDPGDMVLRPTVIGDGIQRPGGFSLGGAFSILADRGTSRQHELTSFRPEWRPLDFGWPFYEGSFATRANAPAAINGPNVVYPFGTGRKEGEGIIAGQFFNSAFDPAFGDSYVFFDVNGSIFMLPSSAFTNGFINTSDMIEDKTQDFVPNLGQINRIVGYGAGVASTFFYLLDADGELFEISQQQP